MDGLFQRRLYRVSKTRWFMHALVFFPFLFRFCWGLIALAASVWFPEWQGIWIMLDKNNPLTAFVFDLTGVLVILGVFLILLRKYGLGSGEKPEGLPRADWPAYGLMGAIIIAGFILEGMRIALTCYPAGAEYSVVGYGISLLFSAPRGLTEVYGFVWYIHAALTGAFIAYIPFSRLLHIIIAPVVVAMNALQEK